MAPKAPEKIGRQRRQKMLGPRALKKRGRQKKRGCQKKKVSSRAPKNAGTEDPKKRHQKMGTNLGGEIFLERQKKTIQQRKNPKKNFRFAKSKGGWLRSNTHNTFHSKTVWILVKMLFFNMIVFFCWWLGLKSLAF